MNAKRVAALKEIEDDLELAWGKAYDAELSETAGRWIDQAHIRITELRKQEESRDGND